MSLGGSEVASVCTHGDECTGDTENGCEERLWVSFGRKMAIDAFRGLTKNSGFENTSHSQIR